MTQMSFCEAEIGLADIENRHAVAKGRSRGIDLELGISRCTLLYREWANNKVLLYSKGSYNQHSMISHNGKEYFKKECIHICITESPCYKQKLTQRCKSTIFQFFKWNLNHLSYLFLFVKCFLPSCWEWSLGRNCGWLNESRYCVFANCILNLFTFIIRLLGRLLSAS